MAEHGDAAFYVARQRADNARLKGICEPEDSHEWWNAVRFSIRKRDGTSHVDSATRYLTEP